MTEQINRALDMAHLWLINDIIHSWVDPAFITIVGVCGTYLAWRGIKWMIEND